MKRILIIQTASIGDVILATALVETLHHSYPEASLDFLVKKGNETLFLNHPFLHQLIVWDKRSKKYSNFLKIIRQVRQAKYDLVINVQRFFLTGLLTALSGAGVTRGFSKNPLSIFFNRRIQHRIDKGIHEVTRNHSLISDLVISGNILPRLYPCAADEAEIAQFINGRCYTISPASLWFTKQYPVEKWIELIVQIPHSANIYLLGAKSDMALCEELITRTGHPGITSLAGKLTFLQSAALMKRAHMNFTNDSAPMHLSSAVNAPVTAVYCSTIPGFGFGPLSSDSCVAQTDSLLSCRPCGLHGYSACPEKHFRCALTIDTGKLAGRL